MKRLLLIIGVVLMLSGCTSSDGQETDIVEVQYPEIEESNELMYEELYGESMEKMYPMLREIYERIIEFQEHGQMWIGTEEIKTPHGGFSEVLEATTNYDRDTNRVDSYLINPYNGDNQLETLIRGSRIYQRYEETGIVDTTSFYWDEIEPGYYYVPGLNSRIDMSLVRMMYFIDSSEVFKETEPGGTKYIAPITDIDKLREYGKLDITDDYVQFIKSAKDYAIEGAEVLLYDAKDRLVLRLDLYLEDENWSLIKKLEKGEDLFFRDTSGMEPDRRDLRLEPLIEKGQEEVNDDNEAN